MPQQIAGKQLTHSPRWALAGLSLSMLMPSLDTSIAHVGLPTLAQSFSATFQQVQWIVLAYLLAITSLIVGAGRLGDLLGRRRLLLAGIAIFTAASLLCGIAPTLWFLIAARAAQGIGAAVMMALTVAIATETAPKSKTGSAMGLLGTMSAIGTTLGPSLGGILISGFGWRVIFLINVPLGILNFVLAARTLPAGQTIPSAPRPRLDTAGTLLLALVLSAYALAMTSNLALLPAAILGAWLFVRVETRAAAPLIRFAMFRNWTLTSSLALSMLVSTVVMTTLVVGPFYLTRSLGLPAALVGVIMSAGPLVAALTGIPAGRLVDHFGARRISTAGLLAMSTGCFTLSLIPAALGIAGYVAPLVLVTAGYALFQAANNTAIMMDVHPDQRGVISGMLNLSRNLGLITGAAAMGAVFAHASAAFAATAPQTQAIAAAMRATFAVAATMLVAALVIAPASRALLRHTTSN